VPETVSYLHVAFSSVVTESVADVVPDVRDPDGELDERDGGKVSGGVGVVMVKSAVLLPP